MRSLEMVATMFKFRPLILIASIAAAIAVSLYAAPAAAAEARPWLCRDKPVFSSDHAMAYEASVESGREWQIFFMQFEPNAAHDGFDIVSSRVLRGGAPMRGKLAAGRYFVVIMYRASGGYWVCPGTARENAAGKTGVVSDLCFAEDGPTCHATLTVKPDQGAAGTAAP
jgi:hypothetical protein